MENQPILYNLEVLSETNTKNNINTEPENSHDKNHTQKNKYIAGVFHGVTSLIGLVGADVISARVIDSSHATDFTKAGVLLFSTVVGAAAGYVGGRLYTEHIDSK